MTSGLGGSSAAPIGVVLDGSQNAYAIYGSGESSGSTPATGLAQLGLTGTYNFDIEGEINPNVPFEVDAQIFNLGNQSLTISDDPTVDVVSGTSASDYTVAAATLNSPVCSSSTSVAQGGGCYLGMILQAPSAGATSASINVVTNAVNATSGLNLAVSGTVVQDLRPGGHGRDYGDSRCQFELELRGLNVSRMQHDHRDGDCRHGLRHPDGNCDAIRGQHQWQSAQADRNAEQFRCGHILLQRPAWRNVHRQRGLQRRRHSRLHAEHLLDIDTVLLRRRRQDHLHHRPGGSDHHLRSSGNQQQLSELHNAIDRGYFVQLRGRRGRRDGMGRQHLCALDLPGLCFDSRDFEGGHADRHRNLRGEWDPGGHNAGR